MDKLASYINSPLDDFFPVTDKMNGSAIKINDKDYEFHMCCHMASFQHVLNYLVDIMCFCLWMPIIVPNKCGN